MNSGRRTFAYASADNVLYAVAGYNGTLLTSAERIDARPCAPCLNLPLCLGD